MREVKVALPLGRQLPDMNTVKLMSLAADALNKSLDCSGQIMMPGVETLEGADAD